MRKFVTGMAACCALGFALSAAPAFDRHLQRRAEVLIKRLLDHFDYTGVMALELFIKGNELLGCWVPLLNAMFGCANYQRSIIFCQK